MRHKFLAAVFFSALGVLFVALPLSILDQRDLRDVLALLTGIELPIVWLAVWDVFCQSLRQRSVPMHFGNVTRMIEMKGK